MNFLYSLVFCCPVVLMQVWHADSSCEHIEGYSGVISHKTEYQNEKCWTINPSEESLINLKLVQFSINHYYCPEANIKLSDNNGKSDLLCPNDISKWTNKTLTFKGTVNIKLYLRNYWTSISFLLEYDIQSFICVKKDHFRCSSWQCIFSKQVCDGVEDCKNGVDEMNCGNLENNETRISREDAVNWLKSRHTNFGWGKNTHRAVTALYLADAAKYRGVTEEEIFVRQLQLNTATSLLRNFTEPISTNELSMYVNALLVTCHNVRNIFSEDLLKILADRTFSNSPASPGAYLTLCNANWPLSENNVYPLLNILKKNIDYPFALEIRAMTIMALSCMRQKYLSVRNSYNVTSIYNKTIDNFILSQKQDGSFGNTHTTAMVTQALISSFQLNNIKWNENKALDFLMMSFNTSSIDFLTVYLTLPLFNRKTLLNIGNVNCSGHERKLEEDEDMLDVVDKLGAKIHVEYSLYIGDDQKVLQNIYLKVLENSTVLDVMNVAQITDPKYRFSYHKTNGQTYIYEIAGLSNDIEAGKFWLFYTARNSNSTPEHFTQSPEQIVVEDEEHLIIWYKSVNF